MSQLKRQLLDGASEVFTRGKQSKDKEEVQAREGELYQQHFFAEPLRRRQVADGAGVAQKNLSFSDARELRNLVDHDHPELSISRERLLLGLPRSTLFYRAVPVRPSTLRIMGRIDALYLQDPFSGSRRTVAYLARKGIPISRHRIRNLERGRF